MPLFGPLNYGALFARRAFAFDQFLPADQDMARRGYPGSGGGAGTRIGLGGAPFGFGGGNGFEDMNRDRDRDVLLGGPPGPGAGKPVPPNGNNPAPFPAFGPQTTRRTQLFGPLANFSAPRL